ncbi:RagB/SusD family nutrient uptake outer membrane protein [Chitinophaga japonensis]|uniref:Putative outer membrane starch-binding protein n=1 Tax=Chitinophaga japonensis TaxID=104662 RepID=A0A562SS91_CHIJA|nr:RagB/SusD family nutrient uptake outer membrane protein [Chitinophaga japonensis]TWI83988.1 putative outer membrane starch-binding protein [Chitinophaga japonensis]
MKQAIILFTTIILFSCQKDFLEKPPSVDVTEDTIFSKLRHAESFLWDTYGNCIPSGFPTGWSASSSGGIVAGVLAAACDEGDIADDWPGANRFNAGQWNANNNPEDDFNQHYKAIRKTNIFIERIDDVPDASAEYKAQLKAEAQFLRALRYFDLLKRYGGVPIVDKRLQGADNLQLPRNTFEDCVNFIVSDCDAALPALPVSQLGFLRGRVHKGAALALKARVLLYAASPLFNSADPYVSTTDSIARLVSYHNYSAARWQQAADAAKAVLDWAPAGSCRLITEYGPDKNYEYVWSQPDNAEIILANKRNGWWGIYSDYFNFTMPPGIYGGWYGISVPLNFVKLYEKKTGGPQTWPASGDNINQLYAELDPRFAQSIGYNGAVWNDEVGALQVYIKPDDKPATHGGNRGGGQWLHKFLPRTVTWASYGATLNWPVFRLAEFYLNYAEALNEAQGPVAEVYTAINAIRARSGMPALSGLSKEDMRTAIRNERAVELAFEEHRYWDVRRWKIAGEEGVMKGKMYGLRLRPIANSSEFHFEQVVFEERIWEDKMYLYPFPNTEIYKQYLQQNPGW